MNDLQILQTLKNLPEEVASLDSPNFTGVPTAPTVSDSTDNSDKIATTGFVKQSFNRDIQSVKVDISTLNTKMSKFDGLDMNEIKQEIQTQIQDNLTDDALQSLSDKTVEMMYSDITKRQENILKETDTLLDILAELPEGDRVLIQSYITVLNQKRTDLVNDYNNMNTSYENYMAGTDSYNLFKQKFDTWMDTSGDLIAYLQTLVNKINALLVGKKAEATREAIFNLLTTRDDGTTMEGIFYAEVYNEDTGENELQLFINGRFAQLKGVKVLDAANQTTFYINESGSVEINATSFSVTGKNIEQLIGESPAITTAVDEATSDLSNRVNELEQTALNVSETVKNSIKDSIITEAEFASLSSLYNDICSRQTAILKEINTVLNMDNINQSDEQSLTNYKSSVISTFSNIQSKYNIMDTASEITVDMFVNFDTAVSDWNNYVGVARSFCQTVLNNIALALTADKLSKTREAVFNALTNNGEIEGIFMTENQLFINGEYIQSKDIKAEDNLIAENLIVKKVNCNKVATMLQSEVSVYVNPNSTTADDTIDFEDGVEYKTLQGAINACPVCLNGKPVNIYLKGTVHENIEIRGKNGGTVYIYLCGNPIYGTIKVWDCTGVLIYGGSSYTQDVALADRPIISPYNMIEFDSYNYTVLGIRTTYMYIKDVNVYGKKSATDSVYNSAQKNYAIGATRGCILHVGNTTVTNSDNGCQAIRGGKIISMDNIGYCSRYGYYANFGGMINICRSTAIGAPTKYTSYDNELITVSSNVTFSTSTSVPTTQSSSIKSSSTKVETSQTLISDYGYSYRISGNYIGSWSSEAIVRQGKYTNGYGMNKGFWFFGNDFNEFKDKTITKVTLVLTRQAAGSYGNTAKAMLVYHNYATKSAATAAVSSTSVGPAVSTNSTNGWSKELTVKPYNESKINTFELTDSTLLNAIRNGHVKGFGLYSTTGTYQQYSGSLKVIITYK